MGRVLLQAAPYDGCQRRSSRPSGEREDRRSRSPEERRGSRPPKLQVATTVFGRPAGGYKRRAGWEEGLGRAALAVGSGPLGGFSLGACPIGEFDHPTLVALLINPAQPKTAIAIKYSRFSKKIHTDLGSTNKSCEVRATIARQCFQDFKISFKFTFETSRRDGSTD
jgi:hypothetical protein